jgi:nitrite reductase/ring-hydroxylating ferredoxin subunit
MTGFVAVCKLDELPPGEVRKFKVIGREIALARVSTGDCYAVDGRCTHLRGPLGEGTLDGTTLTCPWHGSQFDVTSGRLLAWVPKPGAMRAMAGVVPKFLRRDLKTYEVRIEDGQILVKA